MRILKSVVVTGSNKGIGLGIAKNLASKQGWNIIMAVRNLGLGQQSRKELLSQYPHANIHLQKLDISDSKSIDQFLDIVKQKYNNIHVLVNNAGVAPPGEAFDFEMVNWTLQTNFYGTAELSQKILPFIADSGKILTIGSTLGKMIYSKITNKDLKEKWKKEGISRHQLFNLVSQFSQSVALNNYAEKGWPKSAYGVSKLAINIYSSILSRNPEIMKRKIQVYTCCPGFVKTDLTNNKGILSVEQGAKTPVYLIELPFELNQRLQGGLFYLQNKISCLP